MEGEYNPWRWPLRINQQSHNYRYMCAELIRLYYGGQALLSESLNPLSFNTSPYFKQEV